MWFLDQTKSLLAIILLASLLLVSVCINLLFLEVQSEHSLGQGLALAQRVSYDLSKPWGSMAEVLQGHCNTANEHARVSQGVF